MSLLCPQIPIEGLHTFKAPHEFNAFKIGHTILIYSKRGPVLLFITVFSKTIN